VLVERDLGAAVAQGALVDAARQQRDQRVDRFLCRVVGERERDPAHSRDPTWLDPSTSVDTW
jgi:hypothetical protein